MLQSLLADFETLADPVRAIGTSRFFKTGKGEYGEGDIFIGITVPTLRTLSKTYKTLALTDIDTLMISPIHEHRVVALFILTLQYERSLKTSKTSSRPVKASVPQSGRGNEGGLLSNPYVSLYLKNKAHINNRDLVDLSAPRLL